MTVKQQFAVIGVTLAGLLMWGIDSVRSCGTPPHAAIPVRTYYTADPTPRARPTPRPFCARESLEEYLRPIPGEPIDAWVDRVTEVLVTCSQREG